MSSAPLRMVGAMVIEIGGVLLALALLPGLPWEQWKASIAKASGPSAYEAAELPPTLPPSRYGFQLDGQTRPLDERNFAQRTNPVPAPQARPFAPPASVNPRPAIVTEDRPNPAVLPELPAEPQRREYVAETLDRASQQILDSLAAPWSDRSQGSVGVTEQEYASRSQNSRTAVTGPGNEQQYLRPEYPSPPPRSTSLPQNTIPAPTTRFGNPSPAKPLDRSEPFPAPPTIPLEPASPQFQSEIAPQGYTAPSNASNQVSPPQSYYAQPRPGHYEGETTSYERPPIRNEYYAPRNSALSNSALSNSALSPSTLPQQPISPPAKLTGPTHVRPAGPRHVQY